MTLAREPDRETSFALAVQLLQPNDRILVLGGIAGVRGGDGWFSQQDLSGLFDGLRIPQPANMSRSLGQLRSRDLTRTRALDGAWALTPIGDRRVLETLGGLDYERVSAELAGTPGADYASARHTTIAPPFAPGRWQAGIARLLERFPFETNVFCMTRFPREGAELPDPLPQVIAALRSVCRHHGLTLHLASDRQAEDDLLGNVGAYMWACHFGIGLLEDRIADGRGLNDNVLIELGSMLVTGRRCAILRDRTAPAPPTDLSGQIYKPVDFDDLDQVSAAVHVWLSEDLGLGWCDECHPGPGTQLG
jgi:hypothetical protein